MSIDCVVLDKAFQMTIELSKTYPKGFVYWTMGYLGYTCYSADAFEVSIIIFKQLAIEGIEIKFVLNVFQACCN